MLSKPLFTVQERRKNVRDTGFDLANELFTALKNDTKEC